MTLMGMLFLVNQKHTTASVVRFMSKWLLWTGSFSESKTVQAVQLDAQAIISYKSVCLTESKHITPAVCQFMIKWLSWTGSFKLTIQ